MAEAVTYELQDGVVWLVIDRPEARNAINRAVADGLWEGFRRFEGDPDAAVLVLTGAGDAFCAGADLKEMAALGGRTAARDMTPNLGQNIQVTKPVVAAVNGPAFGGGSCWRRCATCASPGPRRGSRSPRRAGARGVGGAAAMAGPAAGGAGAAADRRADRRPPGPRGRAGQPGRARPGLHSEAARLARRIADNAPLSVRAAKAMVHAAGRELDEAVEAWRLFEPVYPERGRPGGPRAFVEEAPPGHEGR